MGDLEEVLRLVTEETTFLNPFQTALVLDILVALALVALGLVDEVMLAATESLVDLVLSLKLLDLNPVKLNLLEPLLWSDMSK